MKSGCGQKSLSTLRAWAGSFFVFRTRRDLLLEFDTRKGYALYWIQHTSNSERVATVSSNINLFPISLYGTERLAEIHLPEEQLRYVRFTASAAKYEAAGNPWCFAIDADGQCIGYLYAVPDSEGDLHLHKLVIDAAHQNNGAGTAAMEEFLEKARSAGASFVFLSVAYGNEGADRFYRRLGFVDTELGIAEAGCKLLTCQLR